ncbi:VWA domain-containing protein [Vibrio navarrensis]|nr:VWA domain-containing protein [Vibrio navarrensis]
MNNQTKLIQNSLPLIAAGLGDKLGIRVTVSGNQAWTDGETINIPDFNITSKEQKDAVLGYVSHEAAHLKFNSFSAIDRVRSNVALKNYWNIFEDMRIENAMIDCMVGTRTWMNQIWINRQKEGNRPVIDCSAPPARIVEELLLMTCRVKYRGQTHLQPYLDAAQDVFCYTFGYKLYVALAELMQRELPNVTSSEKAFELAQKVHELISNHEPEDDQNSANESDSSNEGNDTKPEESNETSSEDGSDSSQGEDQNDSEPSNDGNGPSNDKSESDFQDSEDDKQSNSQHSEQTTQPSQEQIKAAIQSAISHSEEFDDMADFANNLEKMANANTEKFQARMPVKCKVNSMEQLVNLESVVDATSSQITAKLQAIVEQELRVRRKTKTSGLRLNCKKLHRYAVSDARIFQTKGKKRSIDTVVEICIDNSQSMGALLTVAKETQLALAKALSRINGVSITASAFPDPFNRSEKGVLTLLDENESVKQLAKKYHVIRGEGTCTPTATAMLNCIRQVCLSQRENKVIIIVTDGYPDIHERADLTRLVNQAQNSGITVIGVAIGRIASNKSEFHKYFPNALFIQDIKELKTELFKVAKDILVAR